ncbi:hypothetical protein SDC9_171272 [bioreactor metagenome]|uniref:Uncharacterized protein n=1 Tax=bioreactor metagenome TaxID=1076179 RepID=A0A645GDN2_9ZZZZ
MLSQLIGESGTIAKADRDQLLQFAVLIETYTGIVTNLRDYFNQLCLRFIRDDDNDLLFMESLRLISRDHLQQLSGLVQTAANWDLSSALALIDRYLLTKQLHEHFDVIYRHLTADSELIRFGEMMGSVTDLGTLTWDQLNTMQELIDPYRQ